MIHWSPLDTFYSMALCMLSTLNICLQEFVRGEPAADLEVSLHPPQAPTVYKNTYDEC